MSDWDLEGFAKFWQDIEYEEAMREKFVAVYMPDDSDIGEPEDWDDDYEAYDDYDLGDY